MPRPSPPIASHRMGLRDRRGCRKAEVARRRGKVIRAQAPYHKPVKAGTWNHLTFTYDGSRTENGYAFYMNGIRMPIERGSYGAQDSTIAPELKESVKNTAPLTLGAAANGEKGLDGSIGEFRIFNRVISEDEARMAAAWPAIAAAASKDGAQLSAVREGRAEALLPDVPRRRLPGAVGGVCTREQRASRDRAALEHGDGAGGTARLETGGASAVSRDVRSAARAARRQHARRSCRRWRRSCRGTASGWRGGWSIAPTRCSRASP